MERRSEGNNITVNDNGLKPIKPPLVKAPYQSQVSRSAESTLELSFFDSKKAGK